MNMVSICSGIFVCSRVETLKLFDYLGRLFESETHYLLIYKVGLIKVLVTGLDKLQSREGRKWDRVR